MNESVNSIIRSLKSKKAFRDYYKNIKGNKKAKYKSVSVNDYDFKSIKDDFQTLRKEGVSWFSYNIAFKHMCKLTGIPSQNCIIISEKLIPGENGQNTVEICYSNYTKKIAIPSGSTLYHQSPDSTIHELKPRFQGKQGKGYLYSSPRIYFSLRKIPKIYADVYGSTKMTVYVPRETLQTAYVDPLLSSPELGALYIETSFPIPVMKLSDKVKHMKESTSDDVEFDNVDAFMEYYGLTYADEDEDEIVEESVSSKIGKIVRKYNDKKFLKTEWGHEKKRFSIIDKTIECPDQEFKILQNLFDVMKISSQFQSYKQAFNQICSKFGLDSGITTITNIDFEKGEKDCNHVRIHGSKGSRKITIPNGTVLAHRSDNKDVAALSPGFKSPFNNNGFYPGPRVFFGVARLDQDTSTDSSSGYVYTPKEMYKTAYINPSAETFNSRSLFIPSSTQIPVESLRDKKRKLFKK